MKLEVGYCKGCNQVFPLGGPLARASIDKGTPGYCATIGQPAVQVIFPSKYWQR